MYSENRPANIFQKLTVNSFLSGEYQNNLEKAYANQFAGGERVKQFT